MSHAEENGAPSVWTVRDVLGWTTGRFERAALPSARLDAEVLLAHALGCDRVGLYIDFDRPLDPDERQAYRDLVRRRLDREPVAYIIEAKEFYSRRFTVDRRVLVPRPESELLVELALAAVAGEGAPRILDVGTGSGALAITLAAERPEAEVVACDLSKEALALAKRNAADLGVEVRFLAGDLLAPLAADETPFHVIVANLPYVRREDASTLAHELRHEPEVALFDPDARSDGLGVMRRLVTQAPAHLVQPGGRLMLEVGLGQAPAVATLAAEAGFASEPQIHADLAGIDRVVEAAVAPTESP